MMRGLGFFTGGNGGNGGAGARGCGFQLEEPWLREARMGWLADPPFSLFAPVKFFSEMERGVLNGGGGDGRANFFL
jgi:hypothetical protein